MRLNSNQITYIVIVVALHLLALAYYFWPGRAKFDYKNDFALTEPKQAQSVSVPAPLPIPEVPATQQSTTTMELLETNKPYKFVRLLDGVLLANIPEALQPLSDSDLTVKYVDARKPKHEYTYPENGIEFQVDTYTLAELQGISLEELTASFSNGISEQYPGVEWLEQSTKNVGGTSFTILHFKVSQGTENFYSYMTFSSLVDRYLFTNFIYPIGTESSWANDGEKIIDSAVIDLQ